MAFAIVEFDMFNKFTVVLSIAFSAVAAIPLAAQTAPLDPSLVATWPNIQDSYGGVVYVMDPPEAPISVRAIPPRIAVCVNFDTLAQELNFCWTYRDKFPPFGGSGAKGKELATESLSFQPTAVTKKSGAGTVLYVAGYNKRTGAVVVEEWTFNLALATLVNPVTQETTVSLVRSIQKSTVLSTLNVTPIRSLVYNDCSSELMLLESSYPHVLSSVDTAIGESSLQYIADSTTPNYSFLSTTKYFDPLSVKPSAPDGGGFVVTCVEFPAWSMFSAVSGIEQDAVTVLRDSDCDGSFESISTGTYKTEVVDKGYLDHEDLFY